MKYLKIITSSLILNLNFASIAAQEINLPTIDYLQSAINKSITEISTKSVADDPPDEQLQNSTHLRAPNSFIYDIDLAEVEGYSGIKIPIKKAFEVWSNPNWHVNTPLESGHIPTAYVYWEEKNGLISEVDMEIASVVEESKIHVKVNPSKGEGNAVISLHWGPNGNSSDPIAWSWHIWVTDDPTNGVTYGQNIETDINNVRFNPKYMDRNLGAITGEILGHDWHKNIGLLYQWGRKDPIPAMFTKDFAFHELSGLVGPMRNRESIHFGHVLPEIQRPFTDISSNLKFSIQNPIAYVLNADNGTWFSQQQYRVMDNPNTETNETIAWNLWSDNMRGENSNAGSSNTTIQRDSRSYELKSPYDPCPNGWRIPSNMGRNTVNNNHSPFGRYNSGTNDDTAPARNKFYPNQANQSILNAKVYSGMGVDFREAHESNGNSRRIGIFPTTGYYVMYPNNGTPTVVFQDSRAIAAAWSATYSLGGARYFRVVTDPIRQDLGVYGLNEVLINQTTFSMEGLPVRCMQDPNLTQIGDFQTEYISKTSNRFTQGLHNPNTYLVKNENEILIPVSKAFSVHNHLFPDAEQLPSDQLIANVLWTDTQNLIHSVKIEGDSGDPRERIIRVQLSPNIKGNAVISLHNGSIENPVYWSWHIWSVRESVRQVTYLNLDPLVSQFNFIHATGNDNPPLTTTFMDRNLGAIHDLPYEFILNPRNRELQKEVYTSGGFHYQWGRKDPIPSFRLVGGDSYEIYKGVHVNSSGQVNYETINALNYKSDYTDLYANYKTKAGVNSSDSKYAEADKIIWYSAQNPMTFLHKGTTSSTDWVSAEMAVADNRWGHAEGKSIFDPCPAGWRVPDVSKVYENGQGNSPWYNGKVLGSLQGNPQFIESHYNGKFFMHQNTAIGWYFEDSKYFIGNFPTTGIIGKFSPNEVGGTDQSNATAGSWTAALTQQMKGHALAFTVGVLDNIGHKVISTGNISPAYGLNVRCAKDEVRYNGEIGKDIYYSQKNTEEKTAPQIENVEFYPNPIEEYLYTNSDVNFEIHIYNLEGKLIKKSSMQNRKMDLRDLPKGTYVGLVIFNDNSENQTIKLIKK